MDISSVAGPTPLVDISTTFNTNALGVAESATHSITLTGKIYRKAYDETAESTTDNIVCNNTKPIPSEEGIKGIIGAIKQAVSKAGVPVADSSVFVPATPQSPPQLLPAVNPLGRDQASQLAEVINGQQSRPIRTYVVSSDVTSAQSLDRNIVEGASI